ncbi:MAG: S8 family serine peptidase [Bacteroidetes bacterium]|nr:S8 family serine peptidase [Bacteroidota bacterium]
MKHQITKAGIAVVLGVILFATAGQAGNGPNPDAGVSAARVASSDHYLVEFGGDATYFRFAISAEGGMVDEIWDGIHVASISGLSDAQLEELSRKSFVTRLVKDVSVHWVNALSMDLNVRVQAAADNTSTSRLSDAEFYDIQWGLQEIGVGAAWNVTRGSRAVRVGILDTGISPDHVDLMGKYDLDASMNFSASNPSDPKDYIDRHYHGTHVSALIASNNLGVASVAPDVTLVGVKVLDDNGNATFASLIAGIMYAVDFAHVDVINLSLGGIGALIEYRHLAEILHRAIDYAASHDVVVVASAGNDDTDLCSDVLRRFVTTDEAGTVLVSASTPPSQDGSEARACYSNYGDGLITLAAPGGSIDCNETSYGTMSDMVISAMAPAVARRLGLKNPDGWYMFSSGTSMAAPIVSGVAALVKSAHPEMHSGAIVAQLKNTADDLGTPGRDGEFGYGRVNAEKALR